MTQYLVTKDKLDALAASVSDKSGESLPLTIDGMREAVNGIELPNLQTASVKPTTSQQVVEPDSEHNGISSVTVDAISPVLTDAHLVAMGGTVYVPRGWYAQQYSKSVAAMTLPTSASTTGTGTNKATIGRSTSTRYINIPTGYNNTAARYTISAVPDGSAAPSASKSISGSTATVTPKVTRIAGYVTAGTAYGPAVTVTAAELVSGTKEITSNGTGIDVTNYANVDVAVPDDTFVVTLTRNLQTGYTLPDCTYAELMAAISAGKEISFAGEPAIFDAVDDELYYMVFIEENDYILTQFYSWDANGATFLKAAHLFDPSECTATAAEVAYGATFVNSTGPKTGSATRRSSSDLTASGATVTAPAGYYASNASASVASGSVSASATKGTVNNHAISVTPTATVGTAGYLAAGSTNGTAVSVSASELVSGTVTISASGNTDVTNYATASVAAGGATASATKGAVSNHSITVTPSVTKTAGYITAGSANGTAVTVSASELVSGSETKTANGTYDVTNLAELVVNVSGGGSSSVSVGTKTATLSSAASSISFTGLSGNPTSFVVTSSADVSTGGTAAVAVAYDGTSLHGMDVTTQAEADTGYSKSYSSGTLTITATSATFQANEYKLVYTYGGSSSDIHTADVQVGSGATSITFSSLSGRPIYFSCVFKSTFSTSSGYQRVIEVVNDGTSTYGHAFDSSAKAQTSWSYSYSGGALTITSTGTNNGGYFHQPGYYQLTYAVDDSAPEYQTKTAYATTSAQTITPDSGYDALESVSIGAVSQTNLTAANIKSGTTVTISNGQSNLWSVTGTYTGGGGGSVSYDTKTTTASNYPVSLEFTSMKGEPKFFVVRLNAQVSSSGNTTYYYIVDIVSNGTTTHGNCFRIGSTRRVDNITSGYSWSYSGTTLTITSSAASRSASPGAFYSGSYELMYAY